MKAHTMLQTLAGRYALMEGPMRRQLDAQTLLKMAPNLDEEGARVYLERFVAKWRLEVQDVRVDMAARSRGLVRRRPMTDLERLVHEELVQQAPRPSDVTVTVEGEDGEVRAI